VPILLFSVLIQISCAVHCVRNNRNSMWLMVIIFLSLPGCLAYAIFEIFPAYAGRREVRALKSAAARKLDPDREARIARDKLELADTAANRTELGDALAAAGDWREAAVHYRSALAKAASAGDRAALLKLARAELESGDDESARSLLESLPPSASESENDRAALLLARALEGCGETESARALYAELGERMAGCEAHCRLAGLLIAQGRRHEAVAPLTEVERRVKRLDRAERARHGAMYDWAARTLAELR
jgi:hypothetical protein